MSNSEENFSLNKMIKLQTLIKKESALKELCKIFYIKNLIVIKTKTNALNKIEENCKKIFKKKLKIKEFYENLNNNNKISFNFIENPFDLLSQSYEYIFNFFMILRNDNNLMFKILMNSEINSINDCFKSFLNDYFYENILSTSNFEDEYLIIICKLLKNEIFKINNKNENENFLNVNFSIVANILKGIFIKNDVKNYFNSILNDVFEFIENKSDEIKNLSFNINEINDNINNKIKEIEIQLKKNKKNKINKEIIFDEENGIFYDFLMNFYKNSNNNKISSKLIIEKIKNQNKIFDEKYNVNLNSKVLIEILNNTNNDNMKDFIYNQLNNLKNDDNIFINSEFVDIINKSVHSKSVLNFYQFYFFTIIKIIEIIIDKLNENINLIPFSIKYICKIITELVKKKFIGITKIEINSFISKFFFEILFNEFLSNPKIFYFFDEIIISNSKLPKINIIIKILNQLISGKFYNSKEFPNFSPFNSFFIEIMPKFITFFDKLTEINLPNFIEKIINNEKNEYDFFKENSEEIINYKSVCFSLNDLNTIYNIIKINEEKIFDNMNNNKSLENFYKTYKKLSQKIYWDDYINPLIKDDLAKNKLSFFLITKMECNEYFNELNNIKMINKCFSIKEEKNIENNFNNIIKIKNFLCKLLFNFQLLKIKDFPEKIFNQTKLIINEFKKFLNYENYDFENKIFYEMNLNSLLKMIDNLPNETIENELYFSLADDIKNKMKNYDFDCLSLIFDRLKYAKKKIICLDDDFKKLNQNQKTKKIFDFVKNEKVEVEIKLKIDENNKNFVILYKNDKNKTKYEKFKGEKIHCSTIFDFITKFPNFNYYHQFQDLDIFNLVEEINLSKELKEYYNYCFSLIQKSKIFEKTKENEFEFINFKLKSFIISKLYDKIYPQEMYLEDIKIFQFCMKLNWIENFHLLKEKNKNFDEFLPKINFLFKKLEKIKIPSKKCEIINEIDKIIYLNILLNDPENDINIDEKLPFFLYAIIKTKPLRIFSQIKFIDLFIDEEIKDKKGFGMLIAILNCAIKKIKNFSFSDLNNVTEKEFVENCNKIIKNDDDENNLIKDF